MAWSQERFPSTVATPACAIEAVSLDCIPISLTNPSVCPHSNMKNYCLKDPQDQVVGFQLSAEELGHEIYDILDWAGEHFSSHAVEQTDGHVYVYSEAARETLSAKDIQAEPLSIGDSDRGGSSNGDSSGGPMGGGGPSGGPGGSGPGGNVPAGDPAVGDGGGSVAEPTGGL